MKPELKENLLLRMFGSFEYIEKFVTQFVSAVDAAEEGIGYYKANPPADLKTRLELKGTISMWENRALPNFRRMKMNALAGLEAAKVNNYDIIEGLTGSFRGFGKDMDGITDKWWPYVDKSIHEKYFTNLKAAMTTGDNVYRTVGNRWRPGSILDDEITGPIDEQELLKYLQPGETV